jgi:antitoxin component YwqK of YwqJK toxin-antitoxin module
MLLLTTHFIFGCNAQSSKDTVKSFDTIPKVAPERINFTAHIIENHDDGSRGEIDTISGYHKYYYKNGKLQMEGKVTKASPKNYRDGIWKYYNEREQLMNQETYIKEGKVNQLEFMYFINGNPLSKTYQYYEGDYKDKATFKFHKIETLFYTNGQELSERHSINGNIVDEKCWDSKGNPKPIDYLKTIKSVQVDE